MRKVYVHNTVVELCTSIVEGLPLATNDYIKVIVEGVLAAAAAHFPVTYCGYIVMGNHLHILLIIQDPADFPSFVGYIKTELAHAVNNLLGRKGKSVWIPDFDSPVILTPEKVLERMAYIYHNPVRANLVSSITAYPGICTFDSVQTVTAKTTFTKTVKKVSRPAIPTLPVKQLTAAEEAALARALREGKGKEYQLSIAPWAWMQCFPESRRWGKRKVQRDFLRRFFADERTILRLHSRPPLGIKKLCRRDPRTPFESSRSGRKSLCMSSCAEAGKAFVDWYNQEAKKAKEALKRWRHGEFAVKPPPGFFSPGGALLCCALFPAL